MISLSTLPYPSKQSSAVFENRDLLRVITEYLIEYSQIKNAPNFEEPLLSPLLPMMLSIRTTREVISNIAMFHQRKHLKFAFSSAKEHFVSSVPLIQWASTFRCDFTLNDDLCRWVASTGDLATLQWARKQDPPFHWSTKVCAAAAKRGDLNILKFLRFDREDPCPWDSSVCASAAKGGHNEVLEWLRSQDPPCPWDCWTTSYAAEKGFIHVLKWLKNQDKPCPWDKLTCTLAAKSGQVETLIWLKTQNPPCPWDEKLCLRVIPKDKKDIIVKMIKSL